MPAVRTDPLLDLQRRFQHAQAQAALYQRQNNVVQARKWSAQVTEHERDLIRYMGKAAFLDWRNRLLNPGQAPWKNDPRPRDPGPRPIYKPASPKHRPANAVYLTPQYPKGQVVMPELDGGPEERLDEPTKAKLRRSVGPVGGRLYLARVEWLRKRIRALKVTLNKTRLSLLRRNLERRLARRRAELRVLVEMGSQGIIGLFQAQRVGVRAGREYAREHRGPAQSSRTVSAPGQARAQFTVPPARGYRPPPPRVLPAEPGRVIADTPIPGMVPEGDMPDLPEIRMRENYLDTNAFTPQRGDPTPFLRAREGGAPEDANEDDAAEASAAAGEQAEGSELAASPEGSLSTGWKVALGIGGLVGVVGLIAWSRSAGKAGKSRSSSSRSSSRDDDYLMNRGSKRSGKRRSQQGRQGRRQRRAA